MVFSTTPFIPQESGSSSSTYTPEPPHSPSPLPSNSNSTQFVPDEMDLRRFTFAEIKTATRNFSKSLLVGRGGFCKVHRGTINHCGRPLSVAIKRYVSGSSQSLYEFLAEIEMLSMVCHANLVPLIGYCMERKEMILVNEFMTNRTLFHHLHHGLSWTQRLKICLGIAQGLHYLHDFTGVHHGIIHRDVKSINILLDENFTPKITDLGLAIVVAKNNPDYYRTGRTVKSNVYDFRGHTVGSVVLEGTYRQRTWAYSAMGSITYPTRRTTTA